MSDILQTVLSYVPGGESRYAELVQTIKDRAREGALEAVPEITLRVKDTATATIEPYVIGGLVISIGALFFSLASFMTVRRQLGSPRRALSGRGKR